MSEPIQYCTFYVAHLFMGVEVSRVQEVLKHQPITRVPLSSPVVRGLINLRGQIVCAVDLRRRLQLPDKAEGDSMNVVLITRDGIVSLLVDRVGDVLFLDDDDFEQPPDTMPTAQREFIRGAYKLDRELMLALQTDRVTTLTQAREA